MTASLQLGSRVRWLLALCALGILSVPSIEAQQTSRRQVILVSIDALTNVDYLHPDGGLKIPNLDALKAAGCPANGMTGIFPTVTYPSHTAMITGQPPAIHGINTNTPLDPFGYQRGGWFYYAEQITTPTLWQVLRKAGLRTAAISWPVTVGAEIDYLLPEFGPVNTREAEALSTALSTPGLFREMMRVDSVNTPMTDAWRIKAAIKILETRQPDLLALHLSDLDAAQHAGGPHTDRSHAALEKIDSQIGEIRAAVQASGRAAQTTWVIVSDHGFYPVRNIINPMVALREAGLITTNTAGRVTDWRVFMHNEGGSAFFEASDPADSASIGTAIQILTTLASNPDNGIRRVYAAKDLAELHTNPKSFLALEAAKDFGFGAAMDGAVVMQTSLGGKHGYSPDIPELRPSMILSGAGVYPCELKEGVRIVDVAPTVAALLGVQMSNVMGRNINTEQTR